jgi:hypothetical protein
MLEVLLSLVIPGVILHHVYSTSSTQYTRDLWVAWAAAYVLAMMDMESPNKLLIASAALMVVGHVGHEEDIAVVSHLVWVGAILALGYLVSHGRWAAAPYVGMTLWVAYRSMTTRLEWDPLGFERSQEGSDPLQEDCSSCRMPPVTDDGGTEKESKGDNGMEEKIIPPPK